MDIASSIQKITEEIMIKLSRSIRKEYNIKNLCLAGGVALNCVANGKILKEKIFENIWIQPAAGCIQILSKIFSFKILPFATQFKATPPAKHKFLILYSLRIDFTNLIIISSVTF